MKKYIYSLSLLLAISFTGCQQEQLSCCTKAAATKNKKIQPTVASFTGGITDKSIYNLESTWTNQDDQKVKLEKLQGKVQLVAMIYTGCTYACPRTIADLNRIEKALQKYNREELGVVLVSMDPDRDTPAKLREFAAANHLGTDRWTLLTSQPDNILELAALLNVKYKKQLNGDIGHSNIITVLNPRGEIVHQQEGLGAAPDETIKAVEGLLSQI
jgi:protein SCO1